MSEATSCRMGKLHTNYPFDEGFMSKIYKEPKNLNIKHGYYLRSPNMHFLPGLETVLN